MLQYSNILKSAQNTVATKKQCSGNHPQHSCFVGRERAMLKASAFTISFFLLLLFVVKYILCSAQTLILWNNIYSNVTLCPVMSPWQPTSLHSTLHLNLTHRNVFLSFLFLSSLFSQTCLSVCLHLNSYFFLLSQTQVIFLHFVPLLLNLCMLRTDVSEPCTD